MKRFRAAIAVSLTLLSLFPLVFSVETFADKYFDIEVTDGDARVFADENVKKYWRPESDKSQITIRPADGRKTDGIYISRYSEDTVIDITSYDRDGNVLDSIKNGDKYDGLSCFYPLNEQTRKIVLDVPAPKDGKKEYGIGYLALSDPTAPDSSIMKWSSPEEKCDLLMIPTHQDDEYIFLGDILPAYINEGYRVAVTYSCICTRGRYEEGLRGLWHCGVRIYPDYLGFSDCGRKLTFDEAADAWGGSDNVVLALVREIRRKQPSVVVTHDEKGENYHNSHCVTSYAAKKAVELAASSDYDPESITEYGIWTVSKLYLHLYKENRIVLDYTRPLEKYDGKSAYEVAVEAYDFHKSQHNAYKLSWSAIQKGAKYDNTLFGLAYSTVGIDNRDLFSGTSIWNGRSLCDGSDIYVTTTTATTTEPTPTTTVPATETTAPITSEIKPITTEITPITTIPITTTEKTVTTSSPIQSITTTSSITDDVKKSENYPQILTFVIVAVVILTFIIGIYFALKRVRK